MTKAAAQKQTDPHDGAAAYIEQLWGDMKEQCRTIEYETALAYFRLPVKDRSRLLKITATIPELPGIAAGLLPTFAGWPEPKSLDHCPRTLVSLAVGNTEYRIFLSAVEPRPFSDFLARIERAGAPGTKDPILFLKRVNALLGALLHRIQERHYGTLWVWNGPLAEETARLRNYAHALVDVAGLMNAIRQECRTFSRPSKTLQNARQYAEKALERTAAATGLSQEFMVELAEYSQKDLGAWSNIRPPHAPPPPPLPGTSGGGKKIPFGGEGSERDPRPN